MMLFLFCFGLYVQFKEEKKFLEYFHIPFLRNMIMLYTIPFSKSFVFQSISRETFLTQVMSAMTVLPCPSCIRAHSPKRSAHKRATIFFRLYIFAHVFRALAYWARKYTICYQVIFSRRVNFMDKSRRGFPQKHPGKIQGSPTRHLFQKSRSTF